MKKPALNVFAAGVLVGRLDRSDREEDEILFTYRADCSPRSAVSLTMPARADQYDAMGGLLPVFEMNLPEGALRERLRNQFAKAIPEFDDLDLLSIVGSSQIGRLQYSTREQLVDDIPTQDIDDLLTYRGTADLFASLLERFATYSGISGVQPKVLARGRETPDKLVYRGATHIVKTFDPAVYPELAANEFICMRGAAAAGIPTATVRLAENRRLLAVDRFDRSTGGIYLGIEDFCVLEGRRPHGRYDGSYENIARRIVDFVSPEVLTQARDQFALMVAYACAIENGDAHLKNFSVLYEDPAGSVRVAPAYDLVATTPYIPKDTLALTLQGSKQFPDRARLIRFVRLVTGKGPRAATQLLEQVAHGVTVAMQEAAAYGDDHRGARKFTARLIEVMSRGLKRLA
ncbi:MAG TPA: type II toxin-antitoxin system HipA family toxin [Steroidobacteraceae bacterium]